MTVNWYAVSVAIDQLGGIMVDVPESMMDEINGYITETVNSQDGAATSWKRPDISIWTAFRQWLTAASATTTAAMTAVPRDRERLWG